MAGEMSLPGFIAHLAAFTAELRHVEHKAMERAAVIVETRAKAIIGHYQTDTGPFPIWAPLADSTKEERARLGYPEDEPLLRQGTLRDSIDHRSDEREAVVGSNEAIAEYQELGTSRIPPRSFLGTAAHQTGPEVAHAIGGEVVKALVGEQVFRRSFPIP